MAYSKSHFLSWDDDLDLDNLLGDYTCSDIEFSEEEIETKKKQKISKPSDSKKGRYLCSVCANTYSSISGIRGHMRNKHGVTTVKVSDYRTTKENERGVDHCKSPFSTDEFHTVFSECFQASLQNIANNQFRNLSKSVHGKNIIWISKHLQDTITKQEQLRDVLEPEFLGIFQSASQGCTNTNEAVFMKYHEVITKTDLNLQIKDIILTGCDQQLPVRKFSSILFRQLTDDMLGYRSRLYSKVEEQTTASLSDNDQQVLFYISGYIVCALKKESERRMKGVNIAKYEALHSAMQIVLRRENDSERTFVSKYSSWTEKVNRWGLKIPSDNLYLFVRECEMCCQKKLNATRVTSNSYNLTDLKEFIIEQHMTKYYGEKIVTGEHSSYIMEKIISLFLTIRGNGCARQAQLVLQKKIESKKSLRQVLKEINN